MQKGAAMMNAEQLVDLQQANDELERFESGAVRSSDAADVRYDLVSPWGLERLARTAAEGAKKYSDHNWRKGMPVSGLLNHAMRHLSLYLQRDTSEDHLAHAAWNLFAAMEFEALRPELVDLWEPRSVADQLADGDECECDDCTAQDQINLELWVCNICGSTWAQGTEQADSIMQRGECIPCYAAQQRERFARGES